MDQELFNRLVAPIPGDHPGGEDMTFSPDFDFIREARRQDDTSLAQGEWETELKSAEWPKVRHMCEKVLAGKSKDLQVACWYTEALSHMHGFEGFSFGLQVLEVLLTDFWEFLYPDSEDPGLEERAGKVEWLNKQLADTIRSIPLTTSASGAYSWLSWEQSRSVDNLGLKDPAARDLAVASGKLAGETFDKAAALSGLPFYEDLQVQIRRAATRLATMERHIEDRFGNDSPGLKDLRKAVANCDDLVARIIGRLGGRTRTADRISPDPVTESNGYAGSDVDTPAGLHPGSIRSRTDAVNALRHVSMYFKLNEPHSPVALLVARAAKWAEMPLEKWLASVIKDEAALAQLRELLDIPADA